MLQVIPKWQIDVVLSNGQKQSIWISDQFAANVMQQVARIHFSANPLVWVIEIRIKECSEPRQEVSVSGLQGVTGRVRTEPPNQ